MNAELQKTALSEVIQTTTCLTDVSAGLRREVKSVPETIRLQTAVRNKELMRILTQIRRWNGEHASLHGIARNFHYQRPDHTLINPTNLYRVIERITRHSIQDLCKAIAIEEAEFLEATELRIDAIASEVHESIALNTTLLSVSDLAQNVPPDSSQGYESVTSPGHSASHDQVDPTQTTTDFPVLPEA